MEKEFRDNAFHFISEIKVPSFLSTDNDDEEIKRHAWNALVEKINIGVRPDLYEIRRQLESIKKGSKSTRSALSSALNTQSEIVKLSEKYGQDQSIDIGLSKESSYYISQKKDSEQNQVYTVGSLHFSPLDTWGHVVQTLHDIVERIKRRRHRYLCTIELVKFQISIVENVLWQYDVLGSVKEWGSGSQEQDSENTLVEYSPKETTIDQFRVCLHFCVEHQITSLSDFIVAIDQDNRHKEAMIELDIAELKFSDGSNTYRKITRAMKSAGYKWKKGDFTSLIQALQKYLKHKGIAVDTGHSLDT